MCGIAGGYGRADGDALDAMLDALVHRGPDDVGTHVDRDGGAMLGNRRLAIVDVEGGHQPMTSEDGSVVAVVNGEIYNHEALRDRLEDRGHRFATDCDAEAVVHCWEEYGRETPRHLDGMFALAVWDADDETFFVARDRLGVKPLYYAERDDDVLVASELQALLAAGVDATVDERAVHNFFYARYAPWPQTPVAAIRKLPPGGWLAADGDGVDRGRYWRLAPSTASGSRGALADDVRDALERAVERRMMADVPVGAFLSGGLDSTAVVGLMDRHVDDLRTFSVSFADPAIDEGAEARAVADHFGTDHTELTVDLGSLDRFDDVIRRLGEPVADPALLPTALLAERAASDVKAVQTGEGADELFGGYYRYRRLPRHRRIAEHLPAGLLRAAGRLAPHAPVGGRHLRYVGGMASDVDAIVTTASRMDHPVETYLDNDLDPTASGFRDAVEEAAGPEDAPFLTRLEAVDLTHWLPDDLLYKVDQATMGASLEARVPYLDRGLVELVHGLPADVKLDGGYKPLLKRAVADVVPARTLEREKQGFELPLDDWFRGDHEVVERYLAEEAVGAAPVVDADAVADLLAAHRRGRRDHGDTLWKVLTYVAWYDAVIAD